jgi:ribosomal protein S18 acetylase RimI-like enzyme
VGIARYIIMDDEPEVAEFAVTVVDDYQGRGIGRLLLSRLADHARKAGLKTLRGYVRRDNAPMLALLDKIGARIRDGDSSVVTADIELIE